MIWFSANWKALQLFVQLYYYTSINGLSGNDTFDGEWDMCKKVWEALIYTQARKIMCTLHNTCTPCNKFTRLPHKPGMWIRNPNFRRRLRFDHLKILGSSTGSNHFQLLGLRLHSSGLSTKCSTAVFVSFESLVQRKRSRSTKLETHWKPQSTANDSCTRSISVVHDIF